MRLFLVVTLTSTLFYSMTGLVYSEGGFAGALVVKPYPMYPVLFGGGEQGTWARHHPGEPLPWFMQKDLRVIAPFDWEYGEPTGVTIYMFGFLATLLTWVVLTIIGAVKVLREPRGESGLCLHVIRLLNQSPGRLSGAGRQCLLFALNMEGANYQAIREERINLTKRILIELGYLPK